MNLLIITGIFPPDIGGPATYVPRIASALHERNQRVTVLTLGDQKECDEDDYPFELVRLLRNIFKPLRWLGTIFKIIRLGRQADVLYVNGLAMETTLTNLLLRKPLVMKVVGDLAWERTANYGWVKDNFEQFQAGRYGFRVRALRYLRAWWTRQADRVIVPSQYLANWVQGWGVPASKINVIYNAVELETEITPAEIPLSTPIKLVTVGRLVPWKRVDGIIEAIANLDHVGLMVVGEGPERSRLEELVSSLGVAERVYFAGYRKKAETLALMAAGDVFVLNSTYEGLPHVVLEAMLLGLPVVATAVGGTPEVVRDGENGILVPLQDGCELSRSIQQLTDNKEMWERLSTAALISAEAFSVPRMLEETEAVLVDMACSNTRMR